MKTYAFDIDGTICTLTNGDYLKAEPFPDMISIINKLFEEGNCVKIFTARGASSGKDWTVATQKQLEDWGVKYTELITNKKPSFDLLIDDKAIKPEDFKENYFKKNIGFVASSFDLMHPGYILMLKEAKQKVNHLIAALHDDPSTERNSKNKPVQSLEERFIVLSSVRYVDEVCVYKTEEDLLNLLIEKKPDIRVLGTDWQNKTYTGHNLSCEIFWHERNHNWSTSSLRERIYQAEFYKKGTK
jgi:glycerol-3-phosphate cytidylyltransferase